MGLNYFTVQEAIDEARSVYLNDTAAQRYTNARMLDLFKSSLDIILLKLVEADVPYTKMTLPATTVVSTATSYEINPSASGFYAMLPIRVMERPAGATLWQTMIERDWLPLNLTPGINRTYWKWGTVGEGLGFEDPGNQLQFPAGTGSTQLLIDVRMATPDLTAGLTATIKLPGLQSYFAARLAALASTFIGNNPTRGVACESIAEGILQSYLNVNVKKNQSIAHRRKPFNYMKRNGWRFWR